MSREPDDRIGRTAVMRLPDTGVAIAGVIVLVEECPPYGRSQATMRTPAGAYVTGQLKWLSVQDDVPRQLVCPICLQSGKYPIDGGECPRCDGTGGAEGPWPTILPGTSTFPMEGEAYEAFEQRFFECEGSRYRVGTTEHIWSAAHAAWDRVKGKP